MNHRNAQSVRERRREGGSRSPTRRTVQPAAPNLPSHGSPTSEASIPSSPLRRKPIRSPFRWGGGVGGVSVALQGRRYLRSPYNKKKTEQKKSNVRQDEGRRVMTSQSDNVERGTSARQHAVPYDERRHKSSSHRSQERGT